MFKGKVTGTCLNIEVINIELMVMAIGITSTGHAEFIWA